jgi:hypothetical protein
MSPAQQVIVRLIRLMTPWQWATQLTYAAVVVIATAIAAPRFLPIAAFVLPTMIITAVLSGSRPPTRHRRKQPGTKHLAE